MSQGTFEQRLKQIAKASGASQAFVYGPGIAVLCHGSGQHTAVFCKFGWRADHSHPVAASADFVNHQEKALVESKKLKASEVKRLITDGVRSKDNRALWEQPERIQFNFAT